MDGPVDGLMDPWPDGPADGLMTCGHQTGRPVDGWTRIWMEVQIRGQSDGPTDGRIHVRLRDGPADRQTDPWMNTRTPRRTDGAMDGRNLGLTDGHAYGRTPMDEWMVPLTDPPTDGRTHGKMDAPVEVRTTDQMIGSMGGDGRSHRRSDGPVERRTDP